MSVCRILLKTIKRINKLANKMVSIKNLLQNNKYKSLLDILTVPDSKSAEIDFVENLKVYYTRNY